ncbi:hypothetical protein [uncultured Thiodictyon sp.]|uniref:5-methylcytosine restriction system specificity protein McrC n=1 Tax=uncultured Thiodictyon sp. TaxID=1846217 RepID=UPI0025E3DA39|nr:hypothetical protein [uncultured Thiodictyon sp.]
MSIAEFAALPPGVLSNALDERRLRWRGISLAQIGTVAARFDVECVPFIFRTYIAAAPSWCATRWVGQFGFEGESYTILPRIGWGRFEAMLTAVLSVGTMGEGGIPSAASGEGDLLPLAWVLVHEAAWRRNRGAAKAFVRKSVSDAPALRGELDLPAQLAKLIDKQNFACRYDELTYDHPVNRGTLLAIRTLEQHRRFPFNCTGGFHRIAREWAEALAANGVALPERFPAEAMRWSRANDSFRAAHVLAAMIVAERQSASRGGKGVPGFLFDSAEVWELYLWRCLKEVIAEFPEFHDCEVEWPRENRSAPEPLLFWQGLPVAPRIPDLRIRRGHDVALVIDAKYRFFQPPTAEGGGDLAVQMFQYAAMGSRDHAERSPPVVLIYPSCEDLRNGPGDESPYLLGSGRFNLPGDPPLTAWAVKLPVLEGIQPAACAGFHREVRAQLRHILAEAMPPQLMASIGSGGGTG